MTIPEAFEQSKVKVVYTFLILSIVKLLIIVSIIYENELNIHFKSSIIFLIIYFILYKILLINKKYTIPIAHVMVWMGLIMVFSILFVFAKAINIMALQFIFMIILSSFYLLGRTYGIVYSIFGVAPVLTYMFIGNNLDLSELASNKLASPAYEITVFLNFLTIIIAHYLYHEASAKNILEKESLNARLILAVEEANLAAQSKSDFLSTMSHELRTPLNSVIGMAELLREESNSPDQEENLKILNFSAASLHTLINDILDFNKLGSEKLYLEAIGVNLYTLLHDICSGLRLQAKERGLQLNLEVDDEIKKSIVCTDPTRISQIIYNLAGNAIKFTAEGSVTIRLNVISSDSELINIRFSVIDTGIGINGEQQDAIFEPFVQASTSTTRNYGGTGLGLAIVKRLLALFHSTIKLESSEGKGARFWFDIAFKIDKEPVNSGLDIKGNTYDIKDLKILVVEDNPINSLLLKKIFLKWNNTPDFTKDGFEALDKYDTNHYDIILMDVHMPLLDGYETSRRIRNLPDAVKSSVPIIALTASVSSNLSEKIREAGMDDHLSKPYNSKELFAKLLEYKNKIHKNA
ncbi:ATP-binding protein [Daejeonella rubra]|uniref:ATP-binding protein n=1 Tax=Daejeonella rubra TaxID=990371 RepID=UPI0015A000FD|nr:ATP-binding protein [Daejeonella rubra]